MAERGEIRNREHGHQIIDYSQIRWDNITPTDIDGFFEFEDKLFVHLEFKLGDAKLPIGQRKALERVCKRIGDTGAYGLVLVASHNNHPPEDIDASAAIVVEYCLNGKWIKPQVNDLQIFQAVQKVFARAGVRRCEICGAKLDENGKICSLCRVANEGWDKV